MAAEGSDAAEMVGYETDAEVSWKRMERKGPLENDNSIKHQDFCFRPRGREFPSTQHCELQIQECVMIILMY